MNGVADHVGVNQSATFASEGGNLAAAPPRDHVHGMSRALLWRDDLEEIAAVCPEHQILGVACKGWPVPTRNRRA